MSISYKSVFCPLLAQSRLAQAADQILLSAEEQTSQLNDAQSAFDPKRTLLRAHLKPTAVPCCRHPMRSHLLPCPARPPLAPLRELR